MHTVAVGGRDRGAAAALEALGSRCGRPTAGSMAGATSPASRTTARRCSGQPHRRCAPVHVRQVGRLGALRGRRNSLPFIEAQSVRPGMVDVRRGRRLRRRRVGRAGPARRQRSTTSTSRARTTSSPSGLVTHNSIYGFRGADIRNILDFEDDYPDAHVVQLEQNYRSTQTILSAANAVIANNRGRKVKSLWTEIGEGDPIKVRELDDEHAEARFVVGGDRAAGRRGRVARRDRRLLPDERAVAGARGHARARADRLPGHRRHEVLRARRDQGRDRLPDLPRQPGRRRRVHAHRQLAQARDRPDVAVARARPRRHDGHHAVGGAPSTPTGVPALGTAAQKALGRFMSTMERLRERARATRPVGELLEETAARDGLPRRARGRADDRGAGPDREPRRSSCRSRASTTRTAAPARTRGVEEFLQQIALLADADTRRDDEGLVTLMTLHNAKGLEFPIVFIIGCEDGVFPHSPRARRGRRGGGAPARLRRHHPRHARPLHHLRAPPQRRSAPSPTALRSRFLDEIPRELTDQPDRNAVGAGRPAGAGRVASWATAAAASRGGSRRGGAGAAATRPAQRLPRSATTSSTPRSARASSPASSPAAIVVVRFAGDGSRAQAHGRLRADPQALRRASGAVRDGAAGARADGDGERRRAARPAARRRDQPR